MAVVTGFVKKIKFRNENNGYSVLSVSADQEEYILVGTFHYISEGEMIEAEGTMTEHPVYGEQLQVESYQFKEPENVQAMERYLGSGAIEGVKEPRARQIVQHFKADTFRIIEEEPERLMEISGIGEKLARSIAEQMEKKKDMRQAMMFLQGYGISMKLAVKIYQEYGSKMYGILKENPYRLAEDIEGVGFKKADEIAQKVGIFIDSDYRIQAGLLYTLFQAASQGHTYLPKEELFHQAVELLKVEEDLMEKQLMDMQMEKKLVIKYAPSDCSEDRNKETQRECSSCGQQCTSDCSGNTDKETSAGLGEESSVQCQVYASVYYYMELKVARMLHDLNIPWKVPEEEIQKCLLEIQKKEQMELDPLQIQAVKEAVNSGLLIITGGPGTGKTTTINTIIRYFEMEDMEILLAAPTGRAAKRMTEATKYEAKTIHRLLELNGNPGEDGIVNSRFQRNEQNPLEADAIIIDEMSMVDIYLMQSLLKAISPGTRLILVGDMNQLPSVGPGNVLKDMIHSGAFRVVELTRVFRQAAESDIIVNAHRINAGNPINLAKRSRDFLFIRQDNPDGIIHTMLALLTKKLPDYIHVKPFEIQIMTPMRKGALGVERLNHILQSFLNPPSEEKTEKESGGTIFRLGDKVMQIKNNYQIPWEIRGKSRIPSETGTGVFNGDMGMIREINLFAETLTVEFDEGKMVEYSMKQLEELELAYAITIHKSQGSEYPAVIIPIHSGPRMLMTKNLLYTAVTRARTCVCLVGLPETFQAMANNCLEQRRYSGLEKRIEEIEAVER